MNSSWAFILIPACSTPFRLVLQTLLALWRDWLKTKRSKDFSNNPQRGRAWPVAFFSLSNFLFRVFKKLGTRKPIMLCSLFANWQGRRNKNSKKRDGMRNGSHTHTQMFYICCMKAFLSFYLSGGKGVKSGTTSLTDCVFVYELLKKVKFRFLCILLK